jgi:hypothetical protein
MELDDLKKAWKPENDQVKFKHDNIMELIQQKSYGPIAALKRAFRKQILFMAIIPICLFLTNVDDAEKVLTNVLFWSYVLFCAGACVFFYYNYLLVKKMEGMDRIVRSNLEQQVEVLESRLKSHVIAMRIVGLFFILLCEVLPYFQSIRMLDKWHALSPFIRFGAYALFMVLQYFAGRSFSYKKFGQHLAYLKDLLKQMQ